MRNEEGKTYSKSDFGLLEIRHSDFGLGEKNDFDSYDDWISVVELTGEAYHQLREDSNYGRTLCGEHLSDYTLVPKETAIKFVPQCENGCWPIEMTPPPETSIMGNPVQDTSEPLKEMV